MILIALMAAVLTSQPFKLQNGPMPVEQAFELKRAMGEAAFAAEVDAAVGRLQNGRFQKATIVGPCASPAEIAASAQLELVRRTHDPQAYATSQALAEAALAERRALRTPYLGRAKVSAPYGLISRMTALAKAEPNARLAELYRRMAEDQFSGIDSIILRPFFGPGVHTTWEKGLDDAALAYVDATIAGEGCPMNVANADWLKGELRDHGWYKISIYGADADGAAWLIVQHARHDLAFQQEVSPCSNHFGSPAKRRGRISPCSTIRWRITRGVPPVLASWAIARRRASGRRLPSKTKAPSTHGERKPACRRSRNTSRLVAGAAP
jgi:hypothetical protein